MSEDNSFQLVGSRKRKKVNLENKINDPILNLTPENITQHSGIE